MDWPLSKPGNGKDNRVRPLRFVYSMAHSSRTAVHPLVIPRFSFTRRWYVLEFLFLKHLLVQPNTNCDPIDQIPKSLLHYPCFHPMGKLRKQSTHIRPRQVSARYALQDPLSWMLQEKNARNIFSLRGSNRNQLILPKQFAEAYLICADRDQTIRAPCKQTLQANRSLQTASYLFPLQFT